MQSYWVEASWNVMSHAQKPDFVFRRNGRVHLNRWGLQFSRLLAAEVCVSAVVMLDTPSSEVVWRVLTTYSIRQFPLHFPSLASPYAITFQLESTSKWNIYTWVLCCISQSVYDGRVCQKYIHACIDSTTIDIHKFVSNFWHCMGLYTIFKFLICKLLTVIM